MSLERVRSYLRQWNRDKDIVELTVSTATSKQAAEALKVELGRIAKSITLRTASGGMLLLTSGDTKVDNKKFKAVLGFNPKMMTPDEAFALTGYTVGGICPFDLPEHVAIYLDKSLRRYNSIFPACGSASSMIELTIPEIEQYSNCANWIDVCKIVE